MRRLLAALLLIALAGSVALAPRQAVADSGQAVLPCVYESAGPSVPARGPAAPECNAQRAISVTGTISSTVTFPYSFTNGQTAITASFLGAGGINAGGAFSPLQLDGSNRLIVACATGCSGSTQTLPYTYTNGQTATAASFLGAGGIYSSSAPTLSNQQYNPLLLDSAGNLLVNLKTALPGGSNSIGFVNPDTNVAGTPLANGTLNAAVTTAALSNYQASTTFNIAGSAGGVVYTFEAYNDAVPTWHLVQCYNKATGTVSNTANADGQYTCDSNGETKVRVRVSTAGSGSATISYTSSSSNNQIISIPTAAAQTFPTPIPTPAGGVYPVSIATTIPVSIATALTVNQGTSPWVVTTPPPVPYNGTGTETRVNNGMIEVGGGGTSGPVNPISVNSAGTVAVTQKATTGGGFTHYAATSITDGSAHTITSSANTFAALKITWSVPSTTTYCYVTTYNSASPTVGSSFVSIDVINTSLPGTYALPLPPTIGGAMTTALSYAITTTPTGSTACNTSAGNLYVEAWYV